jgi:hypothetical protein
MIPTPFGRVGLCKLFGELIGQGSGPAIVVGGGPSAPASLERLKAAGVEPTAVISANEHGHHQSIYPITHSVCCDGRHGEKRVSMESLLRPRGAPIISPAHFADYRLPEWTLASNTGLTAIAVACFMGHSPVIVVGIDFYRMSSPGVYFHDLGARSNSTAKKPINFERQVAALIHWIGNSAPVRPMGGSFLEQHFRAWPAGVMPYEQRPQARYIRGLPTLLLQARPHPKVSFKLCSVEPGRLWACSPNEARSLISKGAAKLIELVPPPDNPAYQLPEGFIRGPYNPRPPRPALLQSPIGRR